jgi:AraC-like DNA-binding protein/quercetin dioxygenase-like cupin family protein
MSQERQADRQDRFSRTLFEDDGYPVRGLSLTLPDGEKLPLHSHPWAQLVYASGGAMRVSTPDAAWLAPPTRAIWAPSGVPHEIEMRGTVKMRTLYLSPERAAGLSGECRALEVTPLLRELILEIVRLQMLKAGDPRHERLAGVLVDLLAQSETTPLGLPLPKDRRARILADAILDDPGAQASLDHLARDTGASLRTQQRLFQRETGLSLEAWRTRARMQHAVARLSDGASVTETALDCGYDSASAFITAFKRQFGRTPGRYRRSS